jgi:hypothetical protein
LVKAYKPGVEEASFRRDFKAALDSAVEQEVLSRPGAAVLATGSEKLVAWTKNAAADSAGEPFIQWLDFYAAGKDQLPKSLQEAFLARVPKKIPPTFDWTSILIDRANKRLVELLVDARFLKSADLVRAAKATPDDFYESASLDVLLDRGTAPPRTVWRKFPADRDRAAGLLPPDEALADAFAVDSSGDASAWLIKLLSENAEARRGVLVQVLRSPDAVFRLVRYLTSSALGASGKKHKAIRAANSPVVSDLLTVCETAITQGKRTGSTASLVLGLLQLGIAAAPDAVSSETRQEIAETAGRLAEPLVVSALRDAELADERHKIESPGIPMVVATDRLHAAVQEYLRSLPRGSEGELESGARALRYERYRGRREVIQGLLTLLGDSTATHEDLRDQLDTTLFNLGVRPLGVSDAETIFDARQHEPTAPGIVPGTRVSIVRPGWTLGADDQTIVLEKARVAPRES